MTKKRVSWGKRNTKRKRRAEQNYWGGRSAESLTEWLNTKDRPAQDPVEKLIKLHSAIGTPLRDVPREIQILVQRLVAGYKFAVAPVIGDVTREQWEVSWRPAWPLGSKMSPDQGLALIKLIQLAGQGLLRRVRQCRFKKCRQWFFARSEHNPFFCSQKCRDGHRRSTPKWKKYRRVYTRQYRLNLKALGYGGSGQVKRMKLRKIQRASRSNRPQSGK